MQKNEIGAVQVYCNNLRLKIEWEKVKKIYDGIGFFWSFDKREKMMKGSFVISQRAFDNELHVLQIFIIKMSSEQKF